MGYEMQVVGKEMAPKSVALFLWQFAEAVLPLPVKGGWGMGHMIRS